MRMKNPRHNPVPNLKTRFRVHLFLPALLNGLLACEAIVEDPKVKPTASLNQLQSITSRSVEVRAVITSNGGENITRLGVIWSTSTSPTLSNASLLPASVSQSGFTLTIPELDVATRYYVRAFAENSIGVGYSEVEEFSTLAETPEVLTGEVLEATMNSIKIQGEVVSEQGAQVTERGFVLSRLSNPDINDTKILAGSGQGIMEALFEELAVNTSYHIRAYATNEMGTAYGNNVNIRTAEALPGSPPALPPPGNRESQ